MGKTRFSDLENHIDGLLRQSGSQGALDLELDEDDLERLLDAAPRISLSDDFSRRAQVAMADAQKEREERSPAVALGTAVSRARSQAEVDLTEAADQAGVSVKLLEALETGQLSVRQIMRNFPPAAATRMLAATGLAVDEFTSRLMDLAAMGERASIAVTTRVADHRRQRDSTALAMEVAEYVAALQRRAQSEE